MQTKHCPACELKFKRRPRPTVSGYGVQCPRCTQFIACERPLTDPPRVPRDNDRWQKPQKPRGRRP